MGFKCNDKSLMTSPEYLTYHRYSNVYELNTVRLNFQGHIFFSESYHMTPSHRDIPCVCLVTQLCPILRDPMDCNPPDSSVPRDSPGKQY